MTQRTGKRGRPKTTGAGLQVGVRWQEPLLGEIKRWASSHKVIYAEAIRQLVKKGLDCETTNSAHSSLSITEVESVTLAPVPLGALKGMNPAILEQIAAPWRDLDAVVRGAQGWAVVRKKAGHRLVLSWLRK